MRRDKDIRQLNAILSLGFQSGRLYMFLGGTGQVRRFNPQIKPVENSIKR